MKLRMTLLIAVGVCTLSTGMLFAQPPQPPIEPPPNPQPFAGDIQVRAVTNRPDCNFDESFIEAYNRGALSYKVLIERTYTNAAPGPVGPCTNCTDNPECGVNQRFDDGDPNEPPQLMCSTRRDRLGPGGAESDLILYQLSPAGSPGSCVAKHDCFPNPVTTQQNPPVLLTPCGKHCDNLHSNPLCPSLAATCGTPNEWCSKYSDILVTIVAYKAPAWMVPADQWHSANLVVCVLGNSQNDHPGVPLCLVDNYCAPQFVDRHHLADLCQYTFLPD